MTFARASSADSGSAADDRRVEQLERSWFAAMQAASDARAACEALLEERERLRAQWDRARIRLLQLESLRDAIGDEITAIAGGCGPVDLASVVTPDEAKSAA